MSREQRTTERIKSALQSFTDMIESGSFPAQLGEVAMLSIHGDVPAAKWSAGNQLLMIQQGTADARGYRQWQAAGRQVRKGAKALYIFSPRTVTKKEVNEDTGEEEKRTIVLGFNLTPVFAIEDTEGDDIPGYDPLELPPLAHVAEEFGVSLKYAPSPGSYYGYYSPNRKEIVLCTHSVKTFFHELAHAAHDKLGKLTAIGQDKRQEIVAETAAAALSHIYGFTGYETNSRDYIAYYAQTHGDAEKTVREIMRYASEVREVLTLILTTAEQTAGVAA